MLAFYSYEGKDINASDQNWKLYSDPFTIPEGVDLNLHRGIEYNPYYIQQLMDESTQQDKYLENISDS